MAEWFLKIEYNFIFFVTIICAFNLIICVNSITTTSSASLSVNKSEIVKTKREDIERNLVLDNHRKNEIKSFNPSRTYQSNYGESKPKDKDIKDRITIYNNKGKDNSAAGTGYDDRGYGLYAPDEQAYQGYGYQDFDQTPHYGAPQPNGLQSDRDGYYNYGEDDYKEHHRERYPTYGVTQYKPDPHAIALKGILIPLAGVALLGAAAALVTHPILLQLGVITGGKRRRRSIDDKQLYENENSQILNHRHDIVALITGVKNDGTLNLAMSEHRDNHKHKKNDKFDIKIDVNNDKNKPNANAKIKPRHKRHANHNADIKEIDTIHGAPSDSKNSHISRVSNSDYDDVSHDRFRFIEML